MQNDIIAKIDSLVKMSESTANAGTLGVELRDLEVQIKEKKFDLKELKSSMTDDRYFDATSEIVDKNIEISLNKKIKYLNKSLLELTSKVEEVSKDEENKYNELENLKKNIEEATEFVDILNTKISFADESDKDYFKKLQEETENKLKDNKKELTKLTKAYEKVQGKLEALSFSKSEIERKLEEDTEKLIDVKANLLNKRGYVNNELKQEDQDKIDALENEIKDLENQKSEILNDPVMIAEDAKNYLIDDDKTGALKKIKELKEIIEKQPYMDINLNTNEKDLDIELENTEAKRDELSSMISSKNYESVDTTLIKDRIEYVKDKKERLLKEIDNIKEQIKQYDENILDDLNNRINYCENEAKNLKEKLKEYEDTLKDEDLTINKKASLQASFNKKQEEYDNIEKLLNDYKNDRKQTILTSYKLEQEDIANIKEQILKIDEEIKQLEKLSVSSNKAKDLIAMENDKKTLKDLNDTIKAIKKRKSIKSSPSEIFDEIEIILGTGYIEDENNYSFDEEVGDEKDQNEVSVLDDIENFTIEPEVTSEKNAEFTENNYFEMPEILETETNEDEKSQQEEINKETNIIDDIEPIDMSNIEPIALDDIQLEDTQLEEVKPDEIMPPEDIQIDSIEKQEEPNSADLPVVDVEEPNIDIVDINNEKKLKVIDIEPLDSNTEPTESEEINSDEFLIGDYIPEG